MARRALSSASRLSVSVDVVILSRQPAGLSVLLSRVQRDGAGRWELPHGVARSGQSLESVARRVARETAGAGAQTWLEQAGAFDSGRHPTHSDLSVAFLGLVPAHGLEQPETGEKWFTMEALPALASRQRAVTLGVWEALRSRLASSPIAFHLLQRSFTLSDLQAVYEMIIGQSLHKASFRRTLAAAGIVRPLKEWRVEGRGRPAQLYRYQPRRHKGKRHGIRFDMPVGKRR